MNREIRREVRGERRASASVLQKKKNPKRGRFYALI